MCDTVVIHTVGGFGSFVFDVSFDDALDNGRGHRQCGSGQCHVYSLRSAHGYVRLDLASPDRILAAHNHGPSSDSVCQDYVMYTDW